MAASFRKQCFFERKLLVLGIEATVEGVVLGDDSRARAVENNKALDGINRLNDAENRIVSLSR